MSNKLESVRLLIAHDSQDEAEQLMNALRNAGKVTRAELVLSEDELLRALKSGTWELLITRPRFGTCDYTTVIGHLQRLGKPVPVLAVVDDFSSVTMREMLESGVQAVAPVDDRELIMLLVDQQVDSLRLRKELQQTELALHEAEKRLSVLMDQSRDAIAYVVDGMHIHANDAYLEMFGYESADDLAGVPIMDMVSSDDHDKLKKLLRSRAQDENQTHELECTGITPDGEEFAATFVFSPSTYDGEACTQIVIHADAVDESALQEKLQEMSRVDQVTQLYNRSWFMEQLDSAVNAAVNSGQLSAVLYVRVDDFEQHQTEVGIEAGDELLRSVAACMRQTMGDDVVLARVGDEEFAALIRVSDPEEAAPQAEKLRKAIEDLMPEIKARTLQISASIGVAFAREDSRGSQAIMTKALECCNRAARENGGNSVHVHDPMDDVAAGSDEAVAMALRHALEKNALKLWYQPVMNLEEEEDQFFEVYVSMPQKDGEDLPADKFMKIAGESGLAAKVDRWVILTAIRAALEHSDQVRLLINISGYSLEDTTLAAWVAKAIKASRIDGKRLTFQLTEADATRFLKQAGNFASELAPQGCGFSISRFASGLDPFKIFQHVPATMVKFEGSYTQELDNQDTRAKFAELVEKVREQERDVMVSFIESASQMQTLWTMGGIKYLQGFYLQPPAPELEAAALAEE